MTNDEVCSTCHDTGFVSYKQVLNKYPKTPSGESCTTGTVALCLCHIGTAKLNAGVPCAPVSKVFSEQVIAEMFPNGVPTTVLKLDTKLRHAGVPESRLEWTTKTFAQDVVRDSPDLKKFIVFASEWIHLSNSERPDIVVFGPTGTGKTGISTAMLNSIVAAGWSGRFVTLKELSIEWRSSFGANDPSRVQIHESDVVKAYADPDVLIIDEFGGTKRTDFVEDSMTFLIDKRQTSKLPTILTMNIPSANADGEEMMRDIGEMLGPRLMDRLRERAQFWPMVGRSRRSTNKVA